MPRPVRAAFPIVDCWRQRESGDEARELARVALSSGPRGKPHFARRNDDIFNPVYHAGYGRGVDRNSLVVAERNNVVFPIV